MGNDIVSDDGAGIEAARLLAGRLKDVEGVTVLETDRTGFRFIDLLSGYDIAFLIDAIQCGDPVGTVKELSLDDFRGSGRCISVHDIDIKTALELGRQTGFSMPHEVRIFTIEGEDILTLHEGCCETVRTGAAEVADRIEGEVRKLLGK